MGWDDILFIPIVGILASIMIFVWAILGAAVGAFVGWVISLTFLGKWVVMGFAVFGIDAQGKMVAIGAMLGFVGAFFKTTLGKEAEG